MKTIGGTWKAPVFEISTYLLPSVTIYLLRAQLAEYHVNPIVLAIGILGKLMRLALCCSGNASTCPVA